MRRLEKSVETGAAAVEFALIFAIILVPLLVGMVEFGRIFFAQNTATDSARVAARVMAVDSMQLDAAASSKAAAAAAAEAATNPSLLPGAVNISPASCTAGQTVTVAITYNIRQLSGLVPPALYPTAVTGRAAALCGG